MGQEIRYIHINLTQKLPQNSVLKKKDDAFRKDWIQQGIEGFGFSSHISVGNDFAMCCTSGVVQSYDDYQDGKGSTVEPRSIVFQGDGDTK
jgi:hypothetical protein